MTVDTQIAGTHFQADLPVSWLARRLLAVNLSDLAASGARPRYALLSLTAPAGFDHRRFFVSLVKACRAAGVKLVGGDLSRSDRVVASMTLLGESAAATGLLSRRRARAGDVLWCGGTLGESALGRRVLTLGARIEGKRCVLPRALAAPRSLARAARSAVLRHLCPTPQLALGLWLAKRKRAAAIDLSDGLAVDLSRLCRESRVGARLDLGALPYSAGAHELADVLDVSLTESMFHGGEDYVLLFTLPPRERPPTRLGCTRIGEITRSKTLRYRAGEVELPLAPLGWDHLRE